MATQFCKMVTVMSSYVCKFFFFFPAKLSVFFSSDIFFFAPAFCLDNQALEGEAQVRLCGVCVRWALFSSGLSPLRGSQICQQEIRTVLNLLHEKRKEENRGVRQHAQTSPHGALPNRASRGFFHCECWNPVCVRIHPTATHTFACP